MKFFTFLRRLFLNILVLSGLFTTPYSLLAQEFSYNDSWGTQGFSIESQRDQELIVNYSVNAFSLEKKLINGKEMTTIALPGNFLPNDAGAPDLPGSARYIAIPQGAKVKMEILSMRKESMKDIEVAPAFVIPKDSENKPLEYKKNEKIYSRDAYYPAEFARISQTTQIRGLDVVMLGITPYQYNPVTKELIVYRDLKVKISVEGGNGQYGENRLRSPYWDPILKDAVLNNQSIPRVDYTEMNNRSRESGAEYVIVVPDDPDFIMWADSLKSWRIKQGISTMVVTTEEIGGNNANTIENWVNNAYNNWDIPPAAILLVGDYGSSGSTIISPIYNSYCASDHIYADVNSNDMADIVFARMTARDAGELEIMFSKIFDYETNPPTNPDFYNNPITALGWQTERWFQICSEAVGGYFKHVHGKDPVRINAIYGGNPNTDPWSTNQNTSMVTDYFGPDGEGYIPATPQELGGWSGGTASMVNNAINSGAFILQHRDHGWEQGWGEPDYSSSDISGLDNDDLTFVFSINCLTGKYNMTGECFTEVFHRYPKGALGLIAASETSYSFVNDTYVWGMFDNMWPDFMPDYGSTPEPRGLYPSFGNVAGKYYLQQSNWPYNTGNKEVTYHLFHHHGGAFSTLYSEVPQDLTVNHDDVLLAGLNYFSVTADEGSKIALTVGDEIIGLGEGTGASVDIPITPQFPPAVVTLTITKTNFYRYEADLQVIPPDGAYVIKNDVEFTDENNNGQVDNGENIVLSLSMKNVGNEDASAVDVSISTEDEFANITDAEENYGDIASQEIKMIEDAFAVEFAENLPDNHSVTFNVLATDGESTWESSFSLKGHAPMLEYVDFEIDDANGNNNGKVDPGETVDLIVSLMNSGSGVAYEITGLAATEDPFVSISTENDFTEEIASEETTQQTFTVTADALTPTGHEAIVNVEFTSVTGHTAIGSMVFNIGQIPVLVLDLDGNNNSASEMSAALDEIGISHDYTSTLSSNILNDYSSIFLCLGIYSNNHVLSGSEGSALKDFLDAGGKLYMEGGDTWYYDNETAVHPYFHINAIDDGDDDMGYLVGQPGSLAEGMEFNYSGDNNWMDHLTAESGAQLIFENQTPSYGAAVAYDAGDYQTIGSSFEFGGLDDGSSTKKELMEKYLEFFGFGEVPGTPEMPAGETEICSSTTEVEYTTNTVDNADYYLWMLEPEEAGEIIGIDTAVMINWNASFGGTAMLKVCGMGNMGQGELSEGLEINVTQAPTANLAGEFEICQGDSVMLSVDLTGIGPWEITLGDNSMVTAEESPYTHYVIPENTTEYHILAVSDQTGCMNQGEGMAYVMVHELPQFILGADTSMCFYDTMMLSAPEGYAEYLWSDGSTGMQMMVDSAGVGMEGTKDIWLSVTDTNGCEATEHRFVEFTTCAGINELRAEDIQIFPNPGNGKFSIAFETGIDVVDMKVTDAYGKLVYSEEKLNTQNGVIQIDLGKPNNGVYFLIIETDRGYLNKKIVINK